MTRREVAFLLIGLGVGLTLSVVGIVKVLASLEGGAVLTSYSWSRVLFIVPTLLVLTGAFLLLYRRGRKA
jgi:hypothetical protein